MSQELMEAARLDAAERDLREIIRKVAKTYLGTPYHDRAWKKRVGADCATLAMMIYQECGLVPADYEPPMYFPQQWMKKGFEDTTYLNEVLKFSVEITEEEAKVGDLVLYKLVCSFTHGSIMLTSTEVIHTFKDRGAIMADMQRDQVLRLRDKRYFSFVRKALNERT